MKMVITGAAGSIGRALAPLLAQNGHDVVCLDIAAPSDAGAVDPADAGLGDAAAGDAAITWIRASVTDRTALESAFTEADLVIHLAGLSREDVWEQIVAVNINGTQAVLDAAHRADVPRVLLASSVHAAGFVPVAAAAASIADVRPDTFYGVAKATAEALGSLYADRFGMRIVSARIMTFGAEPDTTRSLSTWLSPADMLRLVEAAATTEAPGHHIVWGVSNNTRRLVPLEPGHRIGFFPEDDSEAWASAVSPNAEFDVLGGPFTDDAHPMGVHWG